MVRYPHRLTLVTPGTQTFVKGLPNQETQPSSEVIECEVQQDYSNFSETINGKVTVAKYRVYCADIWKTTRTARTAIYEGREYNIMQPLFNQNGIQLKLG